MSSENSEKVDSSTPISASKNSILQAVIGDGSFEHLMKERTKIRKEKDEHSIAELRVQMETLEKALSAEIKRRVELNRQIERRCQNQVIELQKQFDKAMEERSEKIHTQLSQLDTKIKELNDRLEEEKSNIPKDIERKGSELQTMLKSFQEEFVIEKKDRLNREGRILKQMHDYEGYVHSQLQQMQSERDATIFELRQMLEQSENGRKESDEQFQQLIAKELHLLKEEVQQEVNERKLEDDEIVEALNRYTRNLQ